MTLYSYEPLSMYLYGWSTVFIGYMLYRTVFDKRAPLPPGPWSIPFVGNLQCLIWSSNWETHTDWYRKYDSDIVHVNEAGNSVIILNTLEAATELLHRRSAIYSSRPRLTMLNELIGWRWSFVVMPYGPEWNARRRKFTSFFNPKDAQYHQPQELKAARIFLHRLLEAPEEYSKLLRKMAGSTILSVAYGLDVNAAQDSKYTEDAERALNGFLAASVPGRYLVDLLPWLKVIPSWVPGASFQQEAQDRREDMEKLLHGPFNATKNSNMAIEPCFVTRALGRMSDIDNKDEERVIQQTAGSMYLAGTDTTVTALSSFFLAMVKYPEYQKKAQAELDQVVGEERLPDFTDQNNLPYVQAIVNETLRWQPVNPSGLAHLCIEEDLYKGYRIPKNSTVIPNIWAIDHDERNFPNSHAFNPDRYIRSSDGQLNSDVLESSVFGFGRRICPGKHMALSAMWITIASVLSVFDVSKALDENGNTIEPSGKYDTMSGLQNRPYPFRCAITLRSEDRRKVVSTGLELVDGRC